MMILSVSAVGNTGTRRPFGKNARTSVLSCHAQYVQLLDVLRDGKRCAV